MSQLEEQIGGRWAVVFSGFCATSSYAASAAFDRILLAGQASTQAGMNRLLAIYRTVRFTTR